MVLVVVVLFATTFCVSGLGLGFTFIYSYIHRGRVTGRGFISIEIISVWLG